MKYALLSALSAFLFTSIQAQTLDSLQVNKTANWGVNFANVGLSNWTAGGESSVALGTVFNAKIVRKENFGTWTSQFDFALGGARVGDKNFRKTDDNIILQSKYTKKFSEKFRSAAIAVFRTQLLNGLVYKTDPSDPDQLLKEKISGLLSPGYLSLNLGFDYEPGDYLSISFAPTSGKFTIVTDSELSEAGAFGVEKGKNSRSELGVNLLVAVDVDLMENMNLKSSLNLFTNYGTFGTIDTNWENLIVMKVNKYFNASLGTQLIYDKDILITKDDGTLGNAIQFKHILNFGFNYALF
jgi:hypothetical protein